MGYFNLKWPAYFRLNVRLDGTKRIKTSLSHFNIFLFIYMNKIAVIL